MRDRIEVVLVFSRRQAAAALAVLLLGTAAYAVGADTFTLITTYPSPSGIYQKLVSTAQTILARDGGKVGVGTTAPAFALDVKGDINFTGDLLKNGEPAGRSEGLVFGGWFCDVRYERYGAHGSVNPLTGARTCPSGFTRGSMFHSVFLDQNPAGVNWVQCDMCTKLPSTGSGIPARN